MILALYDVTGIQDFIFSTSKTKENIGASLMIQQVFENYLVDALKTMSEKKVKIDWESSNNLQIKDDSTIDAEVIYIGGGNSLVMFKDFETGVKTTQALSVQLLKATKGKLGLVVGYHETDLEDFAQDLKELHQKVAKKKNEFVQPSPLQGIAITYEASDGLSKSSKDLSDVCSDLASVKRDYAEKKDNFENLLNVPKGFSFPKEFDDLGQIEGDSFIAVVHIDGNSMGDFIDKRITGTGDYLEAVITMRKLSVAIRDTYIEVFRKITSILIDRQTNIEKSPKIKYKIINKNKCKDKTYLPIRPLILSGDDVTFVCNGMIALQLTELFLTNLSEKKISGEVISACAGVSIIKSHYPFWRGYSLAETLCSAAKQKAKAIKPNEPGSWFDYHITYAGFNEDLEVVRQKNYNIDSMMEPAAEKYPQYNLLIRPFRVTGNDVDINNWSIYTKAIKELVSGDKMMPRSRLKKLRNNFQISAEAAQEYYEINKSRGYYLPKIKQFHGTVNQLFKNNQTPYYEILELLDFYIPEVDVSEVEDEN